MTVPLDEAEKALEGHGLQKEGALPRRPPDVACREEGDRDLREPRVGSELLEEHRAVHVRHDEIEQDEARVRLALEPSERLGSVVRRRHAISLVLQDQGHALAHVLVVVDDEDRGRAPRGIRIARLGVHHFDGR